MTEREGRPSQLGGTNPDGSRWNATLAELIRSIETGERVCYVSFQGQSYLVTVRTDESGRKSLRTVLGEWGQLLQLPPCPGSS